MPKHPWTNQFTKDTASQFADEGRLEEWVHKFLTTLGNNKPFSDGLRLEKRYWHGPVEVDLASVNRCCGPEESITFTEPKENWEKRINEMVDMIYAGWEVPPLIVNHTNNYLEINDGNHRHEALLRAGNTHYWAIIWDSESQENLKKLNL